MGKIDESLLIASARIPASRTCKKSRQEVIDFYEKIQKFMKEGEWRRVESLRRYANITGLFRGDDSLPPGMKEENERFKEIYRRSMEQGLRYWKNKMFTEKGKNTMS